MKVTTITGATPTKMATVTSVGQRAIAMIRMGERVNELIMFMNQLLNHHDRIRSQHTTTISRDVLARIATALTIAIVITETGAIKITTTMM